MQTSQVGGRTLSKLQIAHSVNQSAAHERGEPGYKSLFTRKTDHMLLYGLVPFCLICSACIVTYYLVFGTYGALQDRFGFERACFNVKETYKRERARDRQLAEKDRLERQERQDRQTAVKAAARAAAEAQIESSLKVRGNGEELLFVPSQATGQAEAIAAARQQLAQDQFETRVWERENAMQESSARLPVLSYPSRPQVPTGSPARSWSSLNHHLGSD
jgi:hypothetical protein